MSKNAKEGVRLTNFGEILMQLRQERHLSQAELGNVIFVSGGTISNYEKGVHYPDVEKLVALAEYFGVSMNWCGGGRNWTMQLFFTAFLTEQEAVEEHMHAKDKEAEYTQALTASEYFYTDNKLCEP